MTTVYHSAICADGGMRCRLVSEVLLLYASPSPPSAQMAEWHDKGVAQMAECFFVVALKHF